MAFRIPVRIQLLHELAVPPKLGTLGAAAVDLIALEAGRCDPGKITKIPLGFAVQFSDEFAMKITARSGHGLKFGAGVPHGYGLIDSDYRGEVCMVLTSVLPFQWLRGGAIGQATFVNVYQPEFEIVSALDPSERGTGGFGSTDAER